MAEPDAPSLVEALNTALASEHAAVHGYGFVGATAEEPDRGHAATALDEHRHWRDALRDAVLDQGAEPVPAEPGYPLPTDEGGSPDEVDLRVFATELERDVCEAYLQLAAATDETVRTLACIALQEATVRRLQWEPTPTLPAFPGYPEQDQPA
ncbi:ferritin-like domain-containing protein [Lipingzhangella sp. LS1_29]|uniref:Ferritin-like domain-containing protein n=1 Tax=Lipingzhangella rawalii TaxID=2055835 RepID=A0ABU2H6V7_9ACTN|nr:ferritin-like domain-containing protein [Lipingzhangella rawalii]MDS1270560.1 ferritin-like domain-containing protein [Lipingzhangella rawalii]